MVLASVLLIDDAESVVESLKVRFDAEGIPLDTASGWDEGLGLFRVSLHELVIADYHLPGSKHGLRLVGALRQLHPSSRLILISGALPSDADQILANSRLIDRYIIKSAGLVDALIDEARQASKRAETPSDWVSVGKAHVQYSPIDEEELERIDALCQSQLVDGAR